MREDLVGYLMGAIDDSEREEIDARLQSDPEFRERLAHVEQKLSPLGYDESPITAPAGLADRTLAFIDQNSKANLASPVTSNSVTSNSLANTSGPANTPALETGSKYRRDTLGSESDGWSFSDFVVAAGVCLAAACLFFPAIVNGRYNAQMAACQNNLRQLGQAFQQYSDTNNGYFPTVPASGKLAFAGSYAAMLRDKGLIEENSPLLDCPSQGTKTIVFRIPRTKDIHSADEGQLFAIRRSTGGDYAYSIGFIKDKKLRGLQRHIEPKKGTARNIVLADSPLDRENRGVHGRGQNILFEDGRAAFLTSKLRPGSKNDNIYVNDNGYVEPGLHAEDAVLAPSWTPVVFVSNPSR